MPWKAVPFDFKDREGLSEHFSVSGIPRVVVLDGATGAVVNGEARAVIVAKKKLDGLFQAAPAAGAGGGGGSS